MFECTEGEKLINASISDLKLEELFKVYAATGQKYGFDSARTMFVLSEARRRIEDYIVCYDMDEDD